jgi:histone acetyltransferase (RNA polymerase elongator complex component)
MRRIPDTTSSMYEENRYKEYTKDELIELSKG